MIAAKLIASGSTVDVALTLSVVNPDIRALAFAAGWNGSSAVVVNVTAPLINTLDLGATPFPGGITLNISASTIVGGVRGNGSGGTFAFRTRVPVSVSNLGAMNGGGGGGANGGSCWVRYQTTSGTTSSSGGAGGAGQGFQDATSLVVVDNTGGASGVTNTYTGAVLGGQTKPWARGGSGGAGGTWGASGSAGGVGSIGGSYEESYQAPFNAGHAAGPAVDGNAFVTWLATGTRQGALI